VARVRIGRYIAWRGKLGAQMKRACVVLACLVSRVAFADDFPTLGYVRDERSQYLIKFECDPPTEQGVVCKFSEVVVHNGGDAEALTKSLQQLDDDFKKGGPTDKDLQGMCTNVQGVTEAIRSGAKTAPAGMTQYSLDRLLAKPEAARGDTLKFFEALEKACASPTKENFETMARVQNDKEARTCELSLYSWEQNFTKQSPTVWVHNPPPDGMCGVIDIATLEKDGGFWNYRSHRVVTNKDAIKDNKLFSCNNIDENEHLYKWNQEDPDGHYFGCDYIKYP
jgi:hypothetical protein